MCANFLGQPVNSTAINTVFVAHHDSMVAAQDMLLETRGQGSPCNHKCSSSFMAKAAAGILQCFDNVGLGQEENQSGLYKVLPQFQGPA